MQRHQASEKSTKNWRKPGIDLLILAIQHCDLMTMKLKRRRNDGWDGAEDVEVTEKAAAADAVALGRPGLARGAGTTLTIG